ncbi:hypothetical protein [Herbiconiux sp.]|uniref:hypothetical protein n=1 Tax=Herbiconiux sp. TaxID=1871186 RepID=UPI0025C58736|nr:hypothetical protein [Herbiconiux sp.]
MSAISARGSSDIGGWIEHRRGDGELVGWMRPEGDGFVPVDLLGRDVAGEVEWLVAEELLDELGIGYLADPYGLTLPEAREGQPPLRVRIIEVSTRRIRVKKDDFGAIDAALLEYTLEWPMPPELRPLTVQEVRDGFVTGDADGPFGSGPAR